MDPILNAYGNTTFSNRIGIGFTIESLGWDNLAQP